MFSGTLPSFSPALTRDEPFVAAHFASLRLDSLNHRVCRQLCDYRHRWSVAIATRLRPEDSRAETF